ncbi:glycosyltransferase family 4 protein [bacterium]|nr:glycosyltransferase family 4 protein [bacterium]
MRILLVCHVRWFNAEAYYALTLAELFRENGHELVLMTQPGSMLAARAREYGIFPDDDLDLLRANPLILIRSLIGFCKRLRRFRPELIMVHRSESFFFTILSRFLTRNHACVFRVRGDPRPPRNTCMNRWLYFRQCQRVLVPGQVLKQVLLERLAIPSDHVSVVYAPIDHVRFAPAENKSELKRRAGLDPDRLLVGIVGRVGRIKGHDYALQAITQLPSAFERVQFFIAYHEEHAGVESLKQQVARQNLSGRVFFFGYTREIEKLIAAADVGLISSIGSEANCRAAIEFMSCGIPLVATRVGVIPEIVQHGQTGYLVQPCRPDQSAASLARLLDDHELRLTMGRAARQRVEQRFSRQVFYDTIDRLIREACESYAGDSERACS